MNKNNLFGIEIVLVMLLVFVPHAAADNVVYFDPDPSCAAPGEEITVTLWFDTVDGAGAFNDAVHFDPSVVNITSGTPGDFPLMWGFVHYGDYVKIGGWTPDGLDRTGHLKLADLTFKANGIGTSTVYHDDNGLFDQYGWHVPNQQWINGTFNCPCTVPYTISGYTDPAADTVKITNLNMSDVVKDRSADFIDPATGFYNLTLNVTDEVEAGNVLQITACNVTSDYESNCNVSTHEVVNAPGEDDNVNLTLDHYCLNFYPSFPFTTWEQEDWSGPTVMEMLIDHYLDPPDVPNQTVLNETGIGNNLDCNADLQYVDPRGMRYTLNDHLYYPYSPYIAHYGIGSYDDLEGVLHYICYWQHLGPGAAPTYGDYSNWMAIRGIHTSENPYLQSAGSYEIYGFWINDPKPDGIGENTYKTVDQWNSTYHLSLTGVRDGDIYENRYVAVCEPPNQPDVDVRLVHSKARFNGVITADAVDEELAVDVNGVPLNQLICNRKLDQEKDNKVVQAAIDSVNEGLIHYDLNFAEAFDGTVANKPMPVKSDTGDYYLVPFGIESDGMSVLAVVMVDSDGGKFKEASWVNEPAKYLPVTAQDALKIVYKEMKGKSTLRVLEKEKATGKFKKIDIENAGLDMVGVTYNEVEKQSRKAYLELVCRGGSPYYPDWKITIGENTYYVNQEGELA